MTSTRLPGKVLKEVLDRPLLEYQIERLRRVDLADEIVIATTTNDTDLPIIKLCQKIDIPYFRGSEENVLERYYYAAQEFGADSVVRITSDCPIIDPAVVNEVIAFYLNNRDKYDYVANNLNRTYPRGMDTEVFSFEALQKAYFEGNSKAEREHVTLFIYRHPERFRIANLPYFEDQSKHRWTVDTSEDFELIRLILNELYPQNALFDLQDVLAILANHPEWVQINAGIQQKEV